MKIELTMEKTQRVSKVYDVTEEQFDLIKAGINPFKEKMEQELDTGVCEYDFAACDVYGKTIVDWCN